MADDNQRPEFDKVIQDINQYLRTYDIVEESSFETARYCVMDSFACALMALDDPKCEMFLGEMPGTRNDVGVVIPGTSFRLDPVQWTFNVGAMIRWLDYNDTWLAKEWGHPSDNIAPILAIADHLNRNFDNISYTMRDVLNCIINAYEIQGVLALENCFNEVGLDHVILVKVATTAVCSLLLAADDEQLMNAVSNAWLDGHPLRTYRHAPNTGQRKSWAAADAASRGLKFSILTLEHGEPGYPSALTAEKWGFQDALFKGKEVVLAQELGEYVMQNILFKISYPAEFHGQTAVEAAIQLHPEIIDEIDNISKIAIKTQSPAMRIINKTGPLHNFADRDHSLQYMVAVALLHGDLKSEYYSDDFAADPRIDKLREKMEVVEEPKFSEEYLDPSKRSIANSLQVFFNDESSSNEVTISYPIGHRRRRKQAIPLLKDKFKNAVSAHFNDAQASAIFASFENTEEFDAMPVDQFMQLFAVE